MKFEMPTVMEDDMESDARTSGPDFGPYLPNYDLKIHEDPSFEQDFPLETDGNMVILNFQARFFRRRSSSRGPAEDEEEVEMPQRALPAKPGS